MDINFIQVNGSFFKWFIEWAKQNIVGYQCEIIQDKYKVEVKNDKKRVVAYYYLASPTYHIERDLYNYVIGYFD